MLRCVVLFSFCTCFSLVSVAQGLGANQAILRINHRDQQPENRRVIRSGWWKARAFQLHI